MIEDRPISEVILASGNSGKLRELQALLAAAGLTVTPQAAYAVPEAMETGLSFIENAIIKARNAARHAGRPAIADDSGIACDALHGAPGIYSARYAGPAASDADNLRQLLAAMREVPDLARRCRYICVMAYVAHAEDPTPIVCEGRWEGWLAHAPRGAGGFGYDPIFYLPAERRTAAELPAAIKQRLSHRGQALRALVARLTDSPGNA